MPHHGNNVQQAGLRPRFVAYQLYETDQLFAEKSPYKNTAVEKRLFLAVHGLKRLAVVLIRRALANRRLAVHLPGGIPFTNSSLKGTSQAE